MYHPFSIAETLRSAWTILRKNLITLSIYSVISLMVYGLLDMMVAAFFIDNDSYSALTVQFFIQMIVQAYLTLSFYKLILTLMDREYYEFEFKDILPSIRMAFNFILIGLSYGVLIAILTFIKLLLQPYEILSDIYAAVAFLGVLYLLLRSIFCVCFIIDDDSSPFESLKQSFETTHNNFFKTLGLVLSIFIILALALIPIVTIITIIDYYQGEVSQYIILLGSLAWFVVAFPAVQVIVMVAYRKMFYSHLDIDDDVAETN